MPLEGVTEMFTGTQFVPSRVSCYKRERGHLLLRLWLSVLLQHCIFLLLHTPPNPFCHVICTRGGEVSHYSHVGVDIMPLDLQSYRLNTLLCFKKYPASGVLL